MYIYILYSVRAYRYYIYIYKYIFLYTYICIYASGSPQKRRETIRLVLFNLLQTHSDHCGGRKDRTKLDRCVRRGGSTLGPGHVITSHDNDQIPPKTRYFLVWEKSAPWTLVTPFQSEASAAVDDFWYLSLLRFFTLCW